MSTSIINIKSGVKFDIYIGRKNKYYLQPVDSIFCNPFIIGKDGNREEVITKFKEYAKNNQQILDNLYIIDDKILACYCDWPKERCHGEVLIELRKQQILSNNKECKCIIAGSRHINDYDIIKQAVIDSKFNITELICGEAKGVDSVSKLIISNEFENVKINSFPAQWDTYGRSAGYRRNEEMAKVATHLIIIWDGQSKGSGHMIDIAKKYKLNIFEKIVKYV